MKQLTAELEHLLVGGWRAAVLQCLDAIAVDVDRVRTRNNQRAFVLAVGFLVLLPLYFVGLGLYFGLADPDYYVPTVICLVVGLALLVHVHRTVVSARLVNSTAIMLMCVIVGFVVVTGGPAAPLVPVLGCAAMMSANHIGGRLGSHYLMALLLTVVLASLAGAWLPEYSRIIPADLQLVFLGAGIVAGTTFTLVLALTSAASAPGQTWERLLISGFEPQSAVLSPAAGLSLLVDLDNSRNGPCVIWAHWRDNPNKDVSRQRCHTLALQVADLGPKVQLITRSPAFEPIVILPSSSPKQIQWLAGQMATASGLTPPPDCQLVTVQDAVRAVQAAQDSATSAPS